MAMVFFTNAIFASTEETCLYCFASLLNHSCTPNVAMEWEEDDSESPGTKANASSSIGTRKVLVMGASGQARRRGVGEGMGVEQKAVEYIYIY